MRWLSIVLVIILLGCSESVENNHPQTTMINWEGRDSTSGSEKLLMKIDRYPDYDTSQWSEIIPNDYLILDLRYASVNNFSDEALYPCGRCFVRKNLLEGIERLKDTLKSLSLKLSLLDCYRPKRIQQKLWDKFPSASYVTPPEKGSMHNRGLAIDVQLVNHLSEPLDFGTEYDYFGKEAHTDFYNFSDVILDNRNLLNRLMNMAGLKGIRTEWWHYSNPEVMFPIDTFIWDCAD